jgi:hypothetical protein
MVSAAINIFGGQDCPENTYGEQNSRLAVTYSMPASKCWQHEGNGLTVSGKLATSAIVPEILQ